MSYGDAIFTQYYNQHSTYVKDGLQLWLDGIDNTRHGHDATATGWEDISGNNYDFVPYTTGNLPTINADHYTDFAEDTFLKCANSTLASMSNATTKGTLEAVFSITSGTGQVIGFKNAAGVIQPLSKMIVLSSSRLIMAGSYNNSSDPRYRTTENISVDVLSVSIAYNGSLSNMIPKYNGVAVGVEKQTTAWGNNGGDVYVGARVSSANTNRYHYSGNIYCIRYYNRVLTAEEQAHNLAIDKARFNIQ